MITPTLRASIRKPNSEGLVTATGGNDLMHTLGRNRSGVHRTAIIRKIMAYNNTGANVTIQLGTRDGTAPAPLFVAYLPVLLVLNGMENIWGEEHIPAARAIERATAELGVPATRLSVILSCNLNSPQRCIADAVQFTSDATFGRGRIAVLRASVIRMHVVDQQTGDTAVLVLTEKAKALLARLPAYTGVGTDSDRQIENLAREAAVLTAAELWNCRVLRLSEAD